MAIANSIYKVVSYKKETTYGTKAVPTGASTIPRTSLTMNVVKNAFQSARIATHQQAGGTRHGAGYVEGSYADEVSCETHKDFWAALLRGPWTMVSGGGAGFLNVPLTGHTNDSFTIEEWRSDIAESILYLGVKVVQAQVSVQPSGMATVNFSLMGQGTDPTIGAVQYFTTPTAVDENIPASGANGEISVNGAAVAIVTQADFTVNGNGSTGEVIGSKVTPDVFRGIINVTGSFTAYHKDKTLLEKYLNEQTIALAIELEEPGGTDSIKFSMPNVTITGYSLDDTPSGGATASCQFNADINQAGANAKAKSILLIEDTKVA